jgi:hypothetical protein
MDRNGTLMKVFFTRVDIFNQNKISFVFGIKVKKKKIATLLQDNIHTSMNVKMDYPP